MVTKKTYFRANVFHLYPNARETKTLAKWLNANLRVALVRNESLKLGNETMYLIISVLDE